MLKMVKKFVVTVWWGIAMPILLISFSVFLMETGQKQSVFIPAESGNEQTNPSFDRSCMVVIRNTDGTQTQLDLEAYLTGVLLAEVPPDFEPEALKAQAVAARTFVMKSVRSDGKHGNGVVCTEASCCQAYSSADAFLSSGGSEDAVLRMMEAVRQTDGIVLVYEGELIEASYFSCSGGSTEDAAAVWGAEYPYLTAQESPGEEDAAVFTETKIFSRNSLEAALDQKLPDDTEVWFQDFRYTSGRGVDTVRIGDTVWKGTQIRNRLGLRSTIFYVESDDDSVRITTYGYGHRVGMSQYGAEVMAVEGKTYSEILAYYYPGTTQTVLKE